jgi:hypothetical protein
MITGFNTNVRYRGRVFHVQTEDSGRSHPHVISHLYYGGTILASEKRGYSELLESENLTSHVRRLMEEQHRAMLAQLKRGEFDGVIGERLDGEAQEAPAVPEPAPAAVRPAAPPPPAEPHAARAFGEGLVSEKPLDEVILEYLVEKARGRAAARPLRGPRAPE